MLHYFNLCSQINFILFSADMEYITIYNASNTFPPDWMRLPFAEIWIARFNSLLIP